MNQAFASPWAVRLVDKGGTEFKRHPRPPSATTRLVVDARAFVTLQDDEEEG